MQLIKENFWPTIIIVLASFVVIFAFWPLENSGFAEDFRSGEQVEGEVGETESSEEEGFGEGERLTGIMTLIPLIKIAAIMGIGVLFTSIGTGIARFINRRRAPSSPAT